MAFPEIPKEYRPGVSLPGGVLDEGRYLWTPRFCLFLFLLLGLVADSITTRLGCIPFADSARRDFKGASWGNVGPRWKFDDRGTTNRQTRVSRTKEKMSSWCFHWGDKGCVSERPNRPVSTAIS